MYDELIGRMRQRADSLYNASRFYDGDAEDAAILYKAADAIEELSKHLEHEYLSGFADGQIAANRKKTCWIPVAERLPEKRKWVLCKCEANITDVLRYENAEWYHDPTHVYTFNFVTHWMPLPEPPKEETE